jgi:hypothetical protein
VRARIGADVGGTFTDVILHHADGRVRVHKLLLLQADEGCDFDFLRAVPGEEPVREPHGLLSGWVGGW